jgi:hypothetical protein
MFSGSIGSYIVLVGCGNQEDSELPVREVRIDNTAKEWRYERRKSVKLEFLERVRALELRAQSEDSYGTSCRAIDLVLTERTNETDEGKEEGMRLNVKERFAGLAASPGFNQHAPEPPLELSSLLVFQRPER